MMTNPVLDAVAKAAARAGAVQLNGNVVYLKACTQKVFFPFLRDHFPPYLRRYRERFERSACLRGASPEMSREGLDRIRRRCGLYVREDAHQDTEDAGAEPELWPRDPQLTLFS